VVNPSIGVAAMWGRLFGSIAKTIVGGVMVLLFVQFQTDGEGFGVWSPSILGILGAGISFSLVLFSRWGSGRSQA
jgi:hypothetical protein